MKFDYQHLVLMLLALGLAAIGVWRPQLAMYTDPPLAMLVAAGILKWSPLLGPGSKSDAK